MNDESIDIICKWIVENQDANSDIDSVEKESPQDADISVA
jgi:hypothetical protein